jgi:3-oxoacyl-[acyl-carrier protein] reductase
MANYLVIAASSGIGQAVVTGLLTKGHHVFQTSRSQDKINPDALLDATDFDAVDQVFVAAQSKLGKLDGVVNCSGALLLKPAHMTSKEQYQTVIDASLTTSFAVARAAGKYMTDGGSVVFISSAAALEGLPNHDAIAAAKAGLIGLTLSCAATYASNNLRFNAIAPGLTQTPMTHAITENELSRKMSQSMHALGRLGQPEDIARAIIFLLDPENSWITGQTLAVDGGLSCLRPKLKA